LIVKQDYDKRKVPERPGATKGTHLLARRIQRPAVRGKKRKRASKRKGDSSTPGGFVDLRKEFQGEAGQHNNDPRTWSAIVQEWEASKANKQLITGPNEFVPESFVRESISRQLGIKPEDVTRKQFTLAMTELIAQYTAIKVIPQGQELETANELFRITVDAAKRLLLCDMEKVADRWRDTPITLTYQSFLDRLQPCIGEGFAQFLRIGKKFPNEIGTNPANWARSMASEVIIERVKSGPFGVYVPQLLSRLDGEEAKAILLEETILEEASNKSRTGATESASLGADAVGRETETRRAHGPVTINVDVNAASSMSMWIWSRMEGTVQPRANRRGTGQAQDQTTSGVEEEPPSCPKLAQSHG
jgi:hypothetical protein